MYRSCGVVAKPALKKIENIYFKVQFIELEIVICTIESLHFQKKFDTA